MPGVFVALHELGGLAVAPCFDGHDVAGKFANHIAAGHPVGQAEVDGFGVALMEAQADLPEVLFQGIGADVVMQHGYL